MDGRYDSTYYLSQLFGAVIILFFFFLLLWRISVAEIDERFEQKVYLPR